MDTELVVRAQDGDEVAFARLAREVHPRLQQLAYRILRDRELATDVTQLATLSIWRNLPQLREPERFEAWCYRLCVNACHKEVRRVSRSIPEIGGQRFTEPAAPDAESAFRAVIDRDQLERGFRSLSFDHRVVLVLRHYLGLSIDEAAEVLDIPSGTAKSRLNRALQLMRRALVADAAPGPRAFTPREVSR